MGFDHFRVGKAGAPFRHGQSSTAPAKRADAATTPDPSCASGAFYKSPILSNSYDSSVPMNVVWDTTLNCLLPAPTLVDIYLDRPGADNSKMHAWTGVPYSKGNYTLNLQPGWWNSTASINAQVMVVASGTPVFLSPIPAGPVITVTYTAPTNGSVPAAADTSSQGSTTVVTPTAVAGVSAHPLSAGKKAAAVLLPLLFVILLGLAYVKISRARGAAKRSEWSEKLDKRMSTISGDWKAVTLGGAKAAVRQSMAQRNSSVFSVGAIRAGDVDGAPVVMGEPPVVRGGSIDIDAQDIPRTSLGSGVGVGVGARRPRAHAHGAPPERGSRAVSFADAAHPRPSLSSAYSRGSRAFHTASAYGELDGEEAPPVPALPSPSRSGAYGGGERRSSGSGGAGNGNRGASVYNGNGTAWSSGERVAGVDGGYGAQCVSPTGRVHSIAYPSPPAAANGNGFAYGDANDQQNSYFSPATPTPTSMFVVPDPSEVYARAREPSADSAYAATTFGEYERGYGGYGSYGSPAESDVPSVMTSPSQTAGPLNLTSEDIRRRMTTHHGQNGEGAWRQSVDEVFGALSLMRTGGSPASPDGEDEGGDGDYLFAPMPETVFAYPGTPAASSFNSSAAPSSPFAMPMSAPTMSPDDMLRAYAAKHASTASAAPSPLSKTTTGAEVVPTLQNTGMRILYKQPDASARARAPSVAGGLIRAGKGARLSK
ncbi:hypothetical protein GGX14DRAFT_476497 [Mycena pura]|uniref:Uncharacterized protein n=1 Tax=Mycena pura TaxID=153505 RepID=A0AAD6V0G6_9AGAR|nr:hypothetical protein GGX14DRAFT_476497 [Mycena pura]